ncbi:hypothetical protein N657DRAFT_428075 [Parathielavia appendiculata]|uniref:Uncharacterized protein n=1 Tax=Parathielavia appendiculata TaxID=2587402 RepID=A0AAN6U080_9PEZI|nr:hypothetical protein N657DRAFT_428075 [Parathielavia appendiculata]
MTLAFIVAESRTRPACRSTTSVAHTPLQFIYRSVMLVDLERPVPSRCRRTVQVSRTIACYIFRTSSHIWLTENHSFQ